MYLISEKLQRSIDTKTGKLTGYIVDDPDVCHDKHPTKKSLTSLFSILVKPTDSIAEMAKLLFLEDFELITAIIENTSQSLAMISMHGSDEKHMQAVYEIFKKLVPLTENNKIIPLWNAIAYFKENTATLGPETYNITLKDPGEIILKNYGPDPNKELPDKMFTTLKNRGFLKNLCGRRLWLKYQPQVSPISVFKWVIDTSIADFSLLLAWDIDRIVRPNGGYCHYENQAFFVHAGRRHDDTGYLKGIEEIITKDGFVI